MYKKKFLLMIFFLVLGSLIITFLLLNTVGKQVENFEIGIYQRFFKKFGQQIEFDSNGVPYVFYEGNLGKQYNTVTVAETAINLSDQPNSFNQLRFFSCINWLKNNYTVLNDSSLIFLVHYDWPGYKMISPWRSAMNQARAMQAFLKAFEKTGDTQYLDYARRSMNSLYTEVKDGGVAYKDKTGYWYEEYADDSVPQSRVLNGMIVVLNGLSDYYKVTKDTGAHFLFNEGVKSVKNTLSLYDNNGHSNYDILGKPSKPWYHNFHIELLDFLYIETRDPIFNVYKQKWSLYQEPSYLSALLQKPSRINVFVVFTLFAGILLVISMISFFVWFRKDLK